MNFKTIDQTYHITQSDFIGLFLRIGIIFWKWYPFAMSLFEKSPFPKLSAPEKEGVLRVSKWLKFQILLDEEEMRDLFVALGEVSIFLVSGVVSQETASLAIPEFLSMYGRYVQQLKSGKTPSHAEFKKVFSSIFTKTSDVLYAYAVGEDRYLIKALRPVIQLQAHDFFLSDVDGKYHPMVLSDESISWGLQISYPQIFQDPKSLDFSKVTVSEEFPNTALFVQLTRWLRRNSLPTPFVYKGSKTYVPMRIGKKCLSWIAHHPQLIKKKLEVSLERS